MRTAQRNDAPRSNFTGNTPSPRYPAQSRRWPTHTAQKPTAVSAPFPENNGHVWREYDIYPYTSRVNSTRRPERALIEWIMRETGRETWHGDQVAALSASNGKLRVYHNPQVQNQVAAIVDQFVRSAGQQMTFRIRVLGVGDPNWRQRARGLLRPIPGSARGPQSWLLAPEDASLMLSEMRRRRDFQEHACSYARIFNGQTATVRSTRGRSYIRQVHHQPMTWPGYRVQMDHVDEGFVVELSPVSSDGRYIDAMLTVHVDQIEKLREVPVAVPAPFDPNNQAHIQVPQLAQRRAQERFHWPSDRVLLVSMGVVPAAHRKPSAFAKLLGGGPPREELLIWVEKSNDLLRPRMTQRNYRAGYRRRY